LKKARVDKQKEEAETWQANEKIKAEGKRLREEKEKELSMRIGVDSKREKEDVLDKEIPPPMGMFSKFLPPRRTLTLAQDPLDTTVRIRFSLKTHPSLNTPQAISTLLSRFGPTDQASIVLSTNLKGKKDKPPKTGSALVPFKQIGDAFAAVCASERKDLGLDGIKISWVRGAEPAILEWLRKLGKLSRPADASASRERQPSGISSAQEGGVKAELPQNQAKSSSTPFSSFPSTFVRLPFPSV
jgi:DnaJ family protein C protein 17